jgi:hypothetical protein
VAPAVTTPPKLPKIVAQPPGATLFTAKSAAPTRDVTEETQGVTVTLVVQVPGVPYSNAAPAGKGASPKASSWESARGGPGESMSVSPLESNAIACGEW